MGTRPDPPDDVAPLDEPPEYEGVYDCWGAVYAGVYDCCGTEYDCWAWAWAAAAASAAA